MGSHKCDISSVVARTLVLLVRRVSLTFATALDSTETSIAIRDHASITEGTLDTITNGFLTGYLALLGLVVLARGVRVLLERRGGMIALGDTPFLVTAGWTLLVAQVMQSVLLGGWLLVREPAVVTRVLRAWRVSMFAGFMGAAASAGWFTAFAIEPIAHVRTLGLVELFFSYVVSRKLFRERLSRAELAGMALLAAGVALITMGH